MPNRSEPGILMKNTHWEGITLEQKYISVARSGSRQAPPEFRRGPSRRKKKVKPRRSPVSSVFWGCYKFLAVISSLIVAFYFGWNFFVKPPAIPAPPTGGQTGQESPVLPIAGGSQTGEEGDVRARRDGVYNFVLLGKDVDSGNTDAIIVVSYDVTNQKVGMISIPRDTAVKRTWRKNPKINGAFHGAGPEVLKEEIQQTFGIPIDYYIHVDLKGFIALVDELKGVDVDIPVNMNYDDPYQNLHIHLKKGVQHLDGQAAMEAVRYRHDNDINVNTTYTDVGRAAMQRQVLTALAKKVISWNSLTKVKEFVDLFQTYVKTDLSAKDMLYFATQALQMDLDNGLTQGNLEGDGNAIYKGFKYCFVFQAEDILPVLNEQVNPYNLPLTEEDLDLPRSEGAC